MEKANNTVKLSRNSIEAEKESKEDDKIEDNK